jgi:hypothetical protein
LLRNSSENVSRNAVPESRDGLGAGDVAHNKSQHTGETHHQDDSEEEFALHHSPGKKTMPVGDVTKLLKQELIDRLTTLVGKPKYRAHVMNSNFPWGLFVKMLCDLEVCALNWPENVPFPGKGNGTTRRGIASLGKAQLTIFLGFLNNCSNPLHKFQFIRMGDGDKGKTSCNFIPLLK